ncbi:MAG TPA: hypothetical protein VIH57_03695 [Bacteroidales bacterium]
MAEVKQNIITQGMSGAIGKQVVFKRYGNRTIVSAMPDMSKVVKSKKQKAENSRFREAIIYARGQVADPVSKAEYKAKAKGMQKPHNVAIADFYHAPEIKKIDASNIRTAQSLTIHAVDDFKVVDVLVEIYDMDGILLEEGHAIEVREWCWSYKITKIMAYHQLHILVAAFDKPGNKCVQELEVVLD